MEALYWKFARGDVGILKGGGGGGGGYARARTGATISIDLRGALDTAGGPREVRAVAGKI